MTEKRFTFADGFKIVAIRDNGEIMNSKQVCNKLNELAEENQALKQSHASTLREFQKGTKKIQQLAKENKELKGKLERKQRRIDAYEDYIKTLKEEGVLDD